MSQLLDSTAYNYVTQKKNSLVAMTICNLKKAKSGQEYVYYCATTLIFGTGYISNKTTTMTNTIRLFHDIIKKYLKSGAGTVT